MLHPRPTCVRVRARPETKRGTAMSVSALSPDIARLAMFNVVRAIDPAELDSRSRVSDRLPGSSRDYRYQLRDRALWRMRFDSPIFSIAIRSAGPVLASHGEGRLRDGSVVGRRRKRCLRLHDAAAGRHDIDPARRSDDRDLVQRPRLSFWYRYPPGDQRRQRAHQCLH